MTSGTWEPDDFGNPFLAQDRPRSRKKGMAGVAEGLEDLFEKIPTKTGTPPQDQGLWGRGPVSKTIHKTDSKAMLLKWPCLILFLQDTP